MRHQLDTIPLLVLALASGSLMTGCRLPVSGIESPPEKASRTESSSEIGSKESSSRRSPYPANVIQNFMNSCMESGGSQASCSCIIDKIQNRYSLEEFSQIEVKAQATGAFPEEVLNFIGTCRLVG